MDLIFKIIIGALNCSGGTWQYDMVDGTHCRMIKPDPIVSRSSMWYYGII
jgi:hypothetical protein